MLHSAEQTCCFTGHRPHKMPWGNNEDDPRCARFKQRMFEAISDAYTDGYKHFLCGMATGCDLWFCETLLAMKPFLKDLTVEAVLPCETQAEHWNERDRNRYYTLLKDCDKTTTLQTAYTPDCMTKRNIYMVDHSKLLLAAFNGSRGGTMHTVNYAIRQGVEVRYIQIDA